jgi:two-component system, OmpR family, phosphate regulon response regulator PhoB
MGARILVVDDEPDISALVAYHLARESYVVRTANTGDEALEALDRERPDLIVLDLMLPGMSGLEVLQAVRARPGTSEVPVILLTARKEEADRIEGFRLGADDYVAKPFSPQELVLRVGAVLRRLHQLPPSEGSGSILKVGPVTLDTGAAQVEVDGRVLALTPTEYRLLEVLMQRRGRVQSRRQLLEAVWETTAEITTRTVDMHIQRVRSKLGEASDWLETVRGFGYRFRAR